MRLYPLTMVFFLALGTAASAQQVAESPEPVTSTQSEWQPTHVPNLEMKVVSGDPGSNGLVVVRLQAVHEVRVPSHWHKANTELTVLHGTAALGLGDKFDPKAMRLLQPGKGVTVQTSERHFILLQAGAEIEMRTEGPLVTEWVDPSVIKDLMKNVDNLSDRSKKKAADDKR